MRVGLPGARPVLVPGVGVTETPEGRYATRKPGERPGLCTSEHGAHRIAQDAVTAGASVCEVVRMEGGEWVMKARYEPGWQSQR